MTLYRAIYQLRPEAGGKLRRMTFASPSAFDATRIAKDWQLPTDRLLTVLPVRELQPQPQQISLL